MCGDDLLYRADLVYNAFWSPESQEKNLKVLETLRVWGFRPKFKKRS